MVTKIFCSIHFIFTFLYLFYGTWNGKKGNLKNKLKFGFHCTRHSVRLFFCQDGVMSSHEIFWINDSWWPNNNALLGMCLCACIASTMNLFAHHMHADSLALVLHYCDISQWIDFRCLTSWYNLHNPNSEGANTDPLLRFQHDVGTKVLCFKCRNTYSREPYIYRKIIHYLFVWGFGWDNKINIKKKNWENLK